MASVLSSSFTESANVMNWASGLAAVPGLPSSPMIMYMDSVVFGWCEEPISVSRYSLEPSECSFVDVCALTMLFE